MTEHADVLAWQLIQASDYYLKNAHALCHKAFNDSSNVALNQYNTLIKASLNCLFKVLRNYSSILDAKIQAILFYKTSQLLFKETISSDLALNYCIKGIQICKRNEPKLTLIKLKLQYLHFQIQFHSSFSELDKIQSRNYINNIINTEIPNDISYLDVKMFFKFIKFKHFKAIYNNHDNISQLTNIYQQLDQIMSKDNHLFKQLVLIHIIELQLLTLKISKETILENISKLKSLQSAAKEEFQLTIPIQFKAVVILFDVLLSLRESEFEKTKEMIQKIDLFVKNFNLSRNKSWQSKLYFTFTVGKEKNAFPFELSWLTFKEFSFISYFYCGILYSIRSWDKKAKSDKIFELINTSLLPNLTVELNSKTLSFEEVQNCHIKHNYFKVLISIYQLLSDFAKDKFPIVDTEKNSKSIYNYLKQYPELLKFVETYNSSKYSLRECLIYNNLIPFVHYLFAMIYQRNGMFIKALFYYTKIRIQCSTSLSTKQAVPLITSSDHIYSDYIQSELGMLGIYSQPLGIDNELYFISTLNSIPLVHYLIENIKYNQKNLSEFDIGYDTHMQHLLNVLKIKEGLMNEIQNYQRIQEMAKTDGFFSLLNLSMSIIYEFYISSKDTDCLPCFDFKKVEQISPLLSSLLYLLRGYLYKKDPGISELENINTHVSYFTSACKFSTQACRSENTNNIAKLGYYEIWRLMNANKNLYQKEKIDHVYKKYIHLATQAEDNNNGVEESKRKRVKFM